ncbi:polyprenyl synthetase family protein [Arcanobacterium hippocoleae]|uniref:polyprenyl synthetase family protein n=1 Tax=Arcanobacterium hippocoleae TaxID=149017 RepID=UPI00333FBB99
MLLGDYLLSLAAHTFESAEAANLAALQRARELYHSMTAEVAFGQYLDNQAEFMPFTTDFTAQIEHSFQVLYHKSARYSVDCPLKIGAALAGASTAQIAQLSRIGKPLGEAFQLRDDYLGVFGSAAHTGKPAGGDLCEGKRTVLIGMTRKLLSKSDREFLDAHLGFPLSDSEISKIQQLIANSGALQAHEALIYEREAQAAQAVAELHTTSPILHELLTLLTNRKA